VDTASMSQSRSVGMATSGGGKQEVISCLEAADVGNDDAGRAAEQAAVLSFSDRQRPLAEMPTRGECGVEGAF